MAKPSDTELQALRALAARKHRAATSKVSRLTSKGADVSGSKFDPRRSLKTVRRYNKTQIKAYIAKLETFSNRSVQFYGDANRAPIPKKQWDTYKALERAHNALIEKQHRKYNEAKLPSGMTIKQRRAMTTPDHPRLSNSANTPMSLFDRHPSQIGSANGLRDLERQLHKRMKPSFRAKQLRADKLSADKMLRSMGRDDLAKAISGLTKDQFIGLWQESNVFANNLSLAYLSYRKMLDSQSELTESDEFFYNAGIDEVGKLIEWARKAL